jgi:hypothetical protein
MHAPVDGPSLLNLYEKGVAIVYVPIGLIIRLRIRPSPRATSARLFSVYNCPLKQSAMSTLGGSCGTANCGGIWSAALPPGDVFANQNFANHMKNLQPPVPYNPPAQACLPQ